MPRDAQGFLKADALMAGVPEQYAVVKDGVRHIVEIRHDAHLYSGYVVFHKQTHLEAVSFKEHEYWFGEDLPACQRRFRTIVKSLGGRA